MPRRQNSASTHNPPRPRARKTRKNGAAARASGESRVSHLRRPQSMPVEEWQQRLRRQFGRAQSFGLENIGDEPVFSEFEVSNPQSGSRYRVAIRGSQPGESFCACPDFATNDLGTCKHIEFVLGALEKKARRQAGAGSWGSTRRTAKSTCGMAATAQVRFRAGTSARRLWPGAPRGCSRVLRRRSASGAVPRARGLSGQRGEARPRAAVLRRRARLRRAGSRRR